MEQDKYLLKLGEITGSLRVVVDQQAQILGQLQVLHQGQGAILGQLGQHAAKLDDHGRRIGKAEDDLSGLKSASIRNSTITGLLAGTGVTIIAEGIRQFLKIKGG